MEPFTSVPISVVEAEIGNSHMSYSLGEGTRELYMRELETLLRTAWVMKKTRSYENCLVTMKLVFLLSSMSRPAFHLLRGLHSLPCQQTVVNHVASRSNKAET
jgi:hypothetical protein